MTGFFRSRWVETPVHAAEAEATALPRGFRAAGVAAGIKPEGLDVGVLASDSPETVSAARFTTNARVGAPVTLSREANLSGLRAVAVNSGCSNVGDGRRGFETAAAMQDAAARKLGLEAESGGRGLDRGDRVRAPSRAGGERRARGLRRPRAGRRGLLGGHPHQRPRPQARLPGRAPAQR